MDRLPAEFLKQWIEKENRRLKMWAEQPPMSPEVPSKMGTEVPEKTKLQPSAEGGDTLVSQRPQTAQIEADRQSIRSVRSTKSARSVRSTRSTDIGKAVAEEQPNATDS